MVKSGSNARAATMARLDILLARNLGWSRARARAAVEDGLVRLAADEPLLDPRADIGPGALPLAVFIDGGPPRALHDAVTVALNKPTGCVTALHDKRHPTAYALLREAPLVDELRPVGRLDLDTSGLLLWTNEGTRLQRWTHPKRAVPRTYQAALAGPFRTPPPDFVLEDGHRPSLAALEAARARAGAPGARATPGDRRARHRHGHRRRLPRGAADLRSARQPRPGALPRVLRPPFTASRPSARRLPRHRSRRRLTRTRFEPVRLSVSAWPGCPPTRRHAQLA